MRLFLFGRPAPCLFCQLNPIYMRITVYQWTAANGRTKYSWFLGDNVDHDRAVEVAESIYSTAEDIVDVTVDAGGRIRHNVTGKYDTF